MEYTPSFADQLQNGSEPSYWDCLVHSELYHHGIKGQRWGVRRPRNEDGIIQGAGAGLAARQKKLRSKANEHANTARFNRKMADSIQKDADEHGAKARATRNAFKKVGHRAAQLWDNNAANMWRNSAKRSENESARLNYKADKVKAKRELQETSAKANARYAKDAKYRKSGQIGSDMEKAIDRFNKQKRSAKSQYKQTVNADKIARLKRRADYMQRRAGADNTMRNTIRKQKAPVRAFMAPTSAAAAVSQHLHQRKANKLNRRINRLSN